jgi:hypothetical protein
MRMGSRAWTHFRANVVAYLALFVALGGGAYAASHINGKTIKKGSIPGNRLKKDGVTGVQVKESTLGTVPRATRAVDAGSATTATVADDAKSANNAKNSDAVGGVAKESLGAGIVSGSVVNFPATGATTYELPPYGVFDFTNDFSVEAIAPINMTVRDFVGEAASGFNAGETATFGLQITPPGGAPSTTALCPVSGLQLTCRADGPVTIPQNATYRLEIATSVLSGNEAIGFQYRDAAG